MLQSPSASFDPVQLLSESAQLSGEPLHRYLEQAGVSISDLERWRLALDQEEGDPQATMASSNKPQ